MEEALRLRILASLVLIAGLTIAGVLLQDRQSGTAAPETRPPATSGETKPRAELVEPEPVREPVGRSEAATAEPKLRSALAASSQARARSGPEPVDIVLVFRAIDESGRAVTGELTLSTQSATQHGYSWFSGAKADAEGRFELRIDPWLEGEQREIEIGARQGTLMALVDLSRPFPPGRTDMGALVLGAVPLIAAGRVIDFAGQPVANAEVFAHTLTDIRVGTVGAIERVYQGEDKTAADGTFTFHGSTSMARVQILLHHEHLRALPLTLPVGSQGIEIIAERSGGVTGQLLLDPGVPLGNLRIMLRPESGPPGSKMESFDSSSSSMAGRDGRFRIEGLLPWTYTLSVAAGSDALAEIPEIGIVAGEITHDPRLEPLDLRGRLHKFTLDLVRPSSSLQLSGWVLFTASGTSTPVHCQSFHRSPVVLVTPLAAIDVMVRARDCRIERLYALTERTEVQLRAAPSVRLVLPRDVVLPDPPLFVVVQLVREDERPEERARSSAEALPPLHFDKQGEVPCWVSDTGRHTVRWFVEHRRKNAFNTVQLQLPWDQVVVVEDVEGEQRFELVVTNGALAAALEAR